jgi:hypothetical protein
MEFLIIRFHVEKAVINSTISNYDMDFPLLNVILVLIY